MISTSLENSIINANCFDIFPYIKSQTIDMIFCDLPYSTTQNQWDQPLQLEDYVICNSKRLNKMQYFLYSYKNGTSYKDTNNYWNKNKLPGLWSSYKRILKERGCIALFCQTPFDIDLGCTNKNMLKYEWIIEKTKATNHLNSKKTPMKAHEKVLIFYKKAPTYNPQMTDGHPPVHNYVKRNGEGNCYGKGKQVSGGGSTKRYPRDVLKYKWDTQKSNLHECQKPLDLVEYFVKTYTNEGDIVLDNCAGSFTTAVACDNLKRNWICIEKSNEFCDTAYKRVNENRKRIKLPPCSILSNKEIIQIINNQLLESEGMEI